MPPAGFVPGASYELTLGDGLYFAGKDQMLRTAYFIIHKDEVDNLQYNADLIFIQDTEDMTYTVNGETLDVLESALLSNEGSTAAITGSFTMPQGGLEAGDVVCIYENIDGAACGGAARRDRRGSAHRRSRRRGHRPEQHFGHLAAG